MINEVVRLIAPKQLRTDFVDEQIADNVVVRPTYLSICAADQRYYTGSRGKEVLSQKLPMALIHEAVGKVMYDPSGKFKPGQKVVLIPNTPIQNNGEIKENYLRDAKFRASGFDGFMQSLVLMENTRIIPYQNIPDNVAALLELVSVVINAIDNFKNNSHNCKGTIGIWGNGNVGFITALLLKKMYPDSKILVFGVEQHKMQFFSFVDGCYLINNVPKGITIDHAFECVGGSGSEKAINMIIDYINPQGSVCLLGVSEQMVEINTRMILEKGLKLLGNSRSSYDDFYQAVKILEENEDIREYLATIISEEIEIKEIADIHLAFEHDTLNDFKIIMKWML